MNYQPTGILTKVQTSAVSGALSAILIWVLVEYAHIDMPEYIAAAITTLIMSLVAYVTPLLPGEIERVPPMEPPVLGGTGKVVEPNTFPRGTATEDLLKRVGPE